MNVTLVGSECFVLLFKCKLYSSQIQCFQPNVLFCNCALKTIFAALKNESILPDDKDQTKGCMLRLGI